jgi:uncharacterized repeat protein (TIGR03803 family)
MFSIAAGAAVMLAGLAAPASASTFNVLHSFCKGNRFHCDDGKNPASALIQDRHGNLYGTTSAGGTSGSGVVFELVRGAKQYHYKVIHTFQCAEVCLEGGVPIAPLIADARGNLYGTATAGGSDFGGTAFELSPNGDQGWSYKVLVNFCSSSAPGCIDGMVPEAGLAYAGASGGAAYDGVSPLYGTTLNGSTPGTVYQLAPSGNGDWTVSVVYSFCRQSGCTDGAFPVGQIAVDATGATVYGTTNGGGNENGSGVAYKVTVSTGTETVLHTFCAKTNCADGSGAQGGVTLGDALVGTTPLGGKNNGGTIFKLDPASGKETVLYAFCKQANCADGQNPDAPVVQAGTNLIGTSLSDGGPNGEIFQLGPDNSLSVLHKFCQEADCTDGSLPVGVLIDQAGTIFGVTQHGGKKDNGLIYQLTALP